MEPLPQSSVELRAGAASIIGRVHEELGDDNEDGYLLDRQHFIFAIFDTHGPKALEVLQTINETIPAAFKDFQTLPPSQKENGLRSVATRIDQRLVEQNLADGSGSTLSLVHIASPSFFWLLHIGDSMVIKAREKVVVPSGELSTSGGNKRKQPDALTLEAVVLTPLHRISTPEELTRVQAAGGAIDDKYVMHPADPDKVIAVTRTLGDIDMRSPECGVIAEPDPVCTCKIDPEDKFLIIVSDGVHERVTPQQIVDRVQRCAAATNSVRQVAVQFLQELSNDVLLDDDATVLIIMIDRTTRTG